MLWSLRCRYDTSIVCVHGGWNKSGAMWSRVSITRPGQEHPSSAKQRYGLDMVAHGCSWLLLLLTTCSMIMFAEYSSVRKDCALQSYEMPLAPQECAENMSFRVDKAWRQRCSQRFRNILAPWQFTPPQQVRLEWSGWNNVFFVVMILFQSRSLMVFVRLRFSAPTWRLIVCPLVYPTWHWIFWKLLQ